MNVARSTFVRKGYLLTALALAVLLAASSGTAWAQTTTTTASSRFARSSGTLDEGATTGVDTPRPLTVTIRRSTRSREDPYNSAGPHLSLAFEYNGAPVSAANGGDAFTVTPTSGSTSDGTALDETSATASLIFAESGVTRNEGTTDSPINVNVRESEIELTIEDAADDDDWLPEELVITLTNHASLSTADVTVRDFSSRFTVTINDDEPMPQFRFTKRDIELAKGNMQDVTVGIGVGTGGGGTLPDDMQTQLATLTTNDNVLLSVAPADAMGRIINITKGEDRLEPDAMGRFVVGQIGHIVDTDDQNDITLTVAAVDAAGFRDQSISLMLMDGRTDAQKASDGGAVEDAAPATVTVLSGEETPTVTFSTDSVTIDEGGMETVHILADTEQGDQVGSVAVSVSGDATISLEQGGSQVSGGVVEFGDSANAELTIRALSDPSLEDGEEKMATVTITDASGANIGDPRELTVTVVGSTAVPVLPLVGQLLLALLLTAGGVRLYRRRQQ